jgi:FAD-dependent monooxygenase
MFPLEPGFIIDQDDNGTIACHLGLDSIDLDVSQIDPYEWVYRAFGGAGKPHRFKIDEILVTSAWRPKFSLTGHYLSPGGRVVFAGDACHRNPPHGDLGMNSGVEDGLAIAWRLSAIIKGYGGPHLLAS